LSGAGKTILLVHSLSCEKNKLRMVGLPDDAKRLRIRSAVSIHKRDGRTDGQTDTARHHRPRCA